MMTERDSQTGRFVHSTGYTDPFRMGRLPDEAAMRLSQATLEALNYAVAQAQQDVERFSNA